MRSPVSSVYRIFRRGDAGAESVRAIVIAMVALAALITAVCVIRVERQHEVLALGYRLSRTQDNVRSLREAHRRLELEYATLSAPERIRRLALELGMAPVAPDHIRAVTWPAHDKLADRR